MGILEDKNAWDNKWFDFLHTFNERNLDYFDDQEFRKYARICEYLAENDEIGSAMTISDIISQVECGGILNYDGYGEFVSYADFKKTGCRDVEDVDSLKAKDKTHFFVWYNK